MSATDDPQPQNTNSKKPPRRYWRAAEPFFDMQLSHWIQGLLALVLLIVAGVQALIYFKQAGIMERALTAVERPILVVTIPSALQITPGTPTINIKIDNFGKQVANTIAISGSLMLQRDSNFPLSDNPNDGSMCTPNHVVGQRVIIQSSNIEVVCQRQRPFTVEQVARVLNLSSYVFSRVTVIYNDSVGSDRLTTWIGLLRPSGNEGRFVQIFSGDGINEPVLSVDQQEQNQRAYIDTILTIERERKSPFPDQ